MLRRLLARLARAFDLARLFELPPGHPDRMIARQLTLYIGLAIIIAAFQWFHSVALVSVTSRHAHGRSSLLRYDLTWVSSNDFGSAAILLALFSAPDGGPSVCLFDLARRFRSP